MPPVAEWWKRETFIPLDWSPPPAPGRPPGRRWARWLVAGVVVVLAATSGASGWLAWQEHRTAQRDHALAQRERVLTQREQAAAQREQALVHLQATQLEALKAQMDSNRQLLSTTSSVAGELQACIDATNQVSSDFFGFLRGNGRRADAANSACSTAEADYQQLQSGTGQGDSSGQ